MPRKYVKVPRKVLNEVLEALDAAGYSRYSGHKLVAYRTESKVTDLVLKRDLYYDKKLQQELQDARDDEITSTYRKVNEAHAERHKSEERYRAAAEERSKREYERGTWEGTMDTLKLVIDALRIPGYEHDPVKLKRTMEAAIEHRNGRKAEDELKRASGDAQRNLKEGE